MAKGMGMPLKSRTNVPVDCHAMASLRVEKREEVVGSRHHLEIGTVAVPRHVDIPAVVRILDKSKRVLSFAIGEDTLYEVVYRTEIVDEICHGFSY